MSSEKYLKVIHQFALRLLQQSSLEDILWLIAGQVISELGFEDCVIYLSDPASGHLIQAAAYGPKSPEPRVIADPITIQIGKGIVGSVAANKRRERISDTQQDDRYILDDVFRRSELAVPILLDGECIGVIDSEHRHVDFFTEKHEAILTTIASMAATKISDAMRARELNATVQKLKVTQQTLANHTLDLVQSRKQAVQVDNSNIEFVTRMSHEIRTAANAVNGMTELLMETSLTSTQEEYASVIMQSSQQLVELITEMIEHLTPARHQRQKSNSGRAGRKSDTGRKFDPP